MGRRFTRCGRPRGVQLCLLLMILAIVYVTLRHVGMPRTSVILLSSTNLTNRQGQPKASARPPDTAQPAHPHVVDPQSLSAATRDVTHQPKASPRPPDIPQPAHPHVVDPQSLFTATRDVTHQPKASPRPPDIPQPVHPDVVDPQSLFTANTSVTNDITNDCHLTRTTPAFQVCLYPRYIDVFISDQLTVNGVWENGVTKTFQLALGMFPQATVLDVGSNIGYYSLLAAAMGHRVIAIEPNMASMKRLARGVQLNGFTDKVIVLNNAVAETHKNVSLTRSVNNQGNIRVMEESTGGGTVQTIVMDDLLDLIPTHNVIMKVDVEGYECRAMAGSRKLLGHVYIPYIFMEWRYMVNDRDVQSSPCPTAAIQELADSLVRLGYQAHEYGSEEALDPQDSSQWVSWDVYWRHRDQPNLNHPPNH